MVQINSDCTLAQIRSECKPQKKILPATFLGSVFAQIFGHIVVLRVKELSNTNLFALRHMLREKVSLPVDVRRSETPLPSPFFQFLCCGEAGRKEKRARFLFFRGLLFL